MIDRRPKLSQTRPPAPRPVARKGRDMALVFHGNGKAMRVPEDPRDIFNDPSASFIGWDSQEDHKAYDRL